MMIPGTLRRGSGKWPSSVTIPQVIVTERNETAFYLMRNIGEELLRTRGNGRGEADEGNNRGRARGCEAVMARRRERYCRVVVAL